MISTRRMRVYAAVSLCALVAAAATMAWSDLPAWLPLLLIPMCVALAVRALPAHRVPSSLAAVVEVVAALAVGTLFVIAPNPGTGTLLYFSSMYYGLRFAQRAAIALAAWSGAVVLVGFALQHSAQWWVSVTITVTVWAGIVQRSRNERTQALEQLVEQSRLTAASEARSSALAERARIARELHDLLAHTLSGAGMQLELADALLEANRPDDARTAVQRARGALADGVSEARNAVNALREDIVDLPTALSALAERPNETVWAEPVDLAGPEALTVLRVAQEAFTNARRHAPGAAIEATLTAEPSATRLMVTNGRSDSAPTGGGTGVGAGVGLIGMRERAAAIGGQLLAGPDAHGWSVTLTVPRSLGLESER